jgi:hypothetical protein
MVILTQFGEGDPDMYISYGKRPTLNKFEWSSSDFKNDVL